MTETSLPAEAASVMPEMVNRFMWAVESGPMHPEATPEKAVETIIAPLLPAIEKSVRQDERERLIEQAMSDETLEIIARVRSFHKSAKAHPIGRTAAVAALQALFHTLEEN